MKKQLFLALLMSAAIVPASTQTMSYEESVQNEQAKVRSDEEAYNSAYLATMSEPKTQNTRQTAGIAEITRINNLDDNDIYNILGVSESSSAETVRAEFRSKLRLVHPDRYPNDQTMQDQAQAATAKLNGAYARIQKKLESVTDVIEEEIKLITDAVQEDISEEVMSARSGSQQKMTMKEKYGTEKGLTRAQQRSTERQKRARGQIK